MKKLDDLASDPETISGITCTTDRNTFSSTYERNQRRVFKDLWKRMDDYLQSKSAFESENSDTNVESASLKKQESALIEIIKTSNIHNHVAQRLAKITGSIIEKTFPILPTDNILEAFKMVDAALNE